MKKTVIVSAIMVSLFSGCATYNKVLDAAKTTAELAPAIITDVKEVSGDIKSGYDSLVGQWNAGDSNAPVTLP